MKLHHERQTRPYGCLYHAVYALTGDRRWLEDEYVNEFSNFRFLCNLAERRHTLFPVYVNNMDDHTPVPDGWWDTLKARLTAADEYAELLVAIQSTQHPKLHHAVALILHPTGGVRISDSNQPAVVDLSWSDFLASPYARTLRVEVLIALDRDLYESENAADIMTDRYGVACP